MNQITHTIDATDRTIGRVASVAAHALLGKRSANFVKNAVAPVKVVVENAGKLHLPGRRTAGKTYLRYTGYPGGLKEMSMAEMIAKKGIAEVLRKTVDGMIPRTKPRKEIMRRLIITD